MTLGETPGRRGGGRWGRLPLRTRLLLAVGAVACVGLLVADVATYVALRSFLVDRTDAVLDSASGPLSRFAFGRRGRHGFDHDGDERADLAAAAPGAYVEVRDAHGDVVLSGSTRREYATATPDLPGGLDPPGHGRARYLTVAAVEGTGPEFRVRAQGLPDGRMLLVALPLDEAGRTLDRLLVIEVLVTLGALAAALGLGLWLVRLGLRPLGDIETTASRVAAGDLSQRVPADPRTEVGRLGASLNAMLGRIEDAFAKRAASEERLRRFVADASHELRTPVSAVGAYAELFERGADERPADLDRVMRGIRAETARMGVLIDDLMLLARMDEGRPLDRVPVELVALMGEAVEAARAVGPDWPLAMEAPGPVEVIGDPVALRQVVDNLLANVRTHTPAGTAATVRVRAEADEAVIAVSDVGPGIGAEHAGRVFERFYRADPSRARDRGGSGLGLAVVAALAEAHGGRVDVDTSPGRGATFRLWLPLAGD